MQRSRLTGDPGTTYKLLRLVTYGRAAVPKLTSLRARKAFGKWKVSSAVAASLTLSSATEACRCRFHASTGAGGGEHEGRAVPCRGRQKQATERRYVLLCKWSIQELVPWPAALLDDIGCTRDHLHHLGASGIRERGITYSVVLRLRWQKPSACLSWPSS